MKNTFEYEITCYIDKNDELGGKLYLNDSIYIDFDENTVFKNSKPLKFPVKKYEMLKQFIKLKKISRIDLARIYLGELYDVDYYEEQISKRLYNLKYEINKILGFDFIKYSRGTTISDDEYSVCIKKKIKRFDTVEKKNVYSVRALFPDEYKDEAASDSEKPVLGPMSFSEKFLHSGAHSLMAAGGAAVISELSSLSSVFSYISAVDNVEASQTDVIKNLYDIIVVGCHDKKIKDILKIKGPLGSYKNRIMQYLYLAVVKNNDDILPFYMDIAYYERIAESDKKVSESDIIASIEKDFSAVNEIKKNNKNKTALLFLDGIRDFSRGNESLYQAIRKQIDNLGCKLVACLDADFTVNPQHSFNMHPLCANDFAHYMRISSMPLYKKDESIEFIGNCIAVSAPALLNNISPEKVFDNLIRLKFTEIDAYWVIYILRNAFSFFTDERCNIVDLYNALCMHIVNDANILVSAAELAYEFEFESTFGVSANLYYDIRWRLIRKHRSVLDFLIAKQYAAKMKSISLTDNKSCENEKQLRIFDMVIQEHISKFAFEMLKLDNDYERQIMRITKKHYDELSLLGKSELTFRITSLSNRRRIIECNRYLKDFTEKAKEYYNSISDEDDEDKKDAAFLLRSLYIGRIYQNDKEAFVEYFNRLMTDKLSNSINRGFHLEYYGDKPFIPDKTLLDYEDVLIKGKKTFAELCLALNRKMDSSEKEYYAAAIELVSLCTLIQARTEQNRMKKVFNVRPYIGYCLKYIEWIMSLEEIKCIDDVMAYFSWMHEELSGIADENTDAPVRYYHSAPFTKFDMVKSVERKGWVEKNIPSPENAVEHMYNCWFIGMLYLPDKYEESGYDKNTILQMLLLHDLVEAKTGNINRIDRAPNEDDCIRQENLAMHSLLLSGTYPGAADLSTYIGYWNTWSRKKSVNYLVAKDIDNIQAIIQFCNYYNQYPEKFTENDVCYWLSGTDNLETELGEEISYKLITNNPEFRHIVEKYDEMN